MNRNFNIVTSNNQSMDKNLINIDINNLQTIINYSADNVFCSCLENLDYSSVETVINEVLQKIKPGGRAIFKVTDLKKHTLDFVNGSISGEDLLKKMKSINCIVSIEDIYTKVDSNVLKVMQVVKNEGDISVVLERISV